MRRSAVIVKALSLLSGRDVRTCEKVLAGEYVRPLAYEHIAAAAAELDITLPAPTPSPNDSATT